MEIFKNVKTEASKEFEKLLDSQFSKTQNLIEGKIIDGVVTKITEKFAFLDCGLKSEAILDINELKTIGLEKKIKVGEKIQVFLERLEDRNGNVVVSASKARQIKGWEMLLDCYEKNEPIIGKFISKTKGGAIVEHIDTGFLMFAPGSQISSQPIKDISALFNEPQKFAIIKADRARGNLCVSRRQIIESGKKEDKKLIIEKYKEGEIIKDAICKGIGSFGVFFNVNNELDVLVHQSEISYQRVTNLQDLFTVGDKSDLKIISVDKEKLQVGCSIRLLGPDPFEKISNYQLNKKYQVKIVKLMEWGIFVELESGLTCLLHSSEISWSKKNVNPKNAFKVGDVIPVIITQIETEKRRISVSHKLCIDNPFKVLRDKNPVGSIIEGSVSSSNEYAIYVKLDGYDIDAFLHCNNLSYTNDPETELKKYKIGDKIKVKILEINEEQQKCRVGLRETKKDPFDYFKDKKISDIITVKIVSSDNRGLVVQPEGAEMNILIKKSQIAVNASDQRATRFVSSDRIDVAVQELNLEKRKVSLSIKLLEEIQKKEALDKYGQLDSGKNLPFSTLSDKLKKKDKEKK